MSSTKAHRARFLLWICLAVLAQPQSPARGSVQDSIDAVVRNHPFLGKAVKPLTARSGGYEREYEGGTVHPPKTQNRA